MAVFCACWFAWFSLLGRNNASPAAITYLGVGFEVEPSSEV